MEEEELQPSSRLPPPRAARAMDASREVRTWPLREVELRESENELTLVGYATVFDVEYEMYGGPPWGWTESFDPGAFDKTLRERPDVRLLLNHEDLPLARTKSGTLALEADKVGLRVEGKLDPTDPDVQRMKPKMARKDLDEMSLAFRTLRQEWNEDYTERKVLEVSLKNGDVSVVTFPANPATSAELKASDLLATLAEMDPEELLVEIRSSGRLPELQSLRGLHSVFGKLLEPAPDPALDARSDTSSTIEIAKRQLELLKLPNQEGHAGAFLLRSGRSSSRAITADGDLQPPDSVRQTGGTAS